MKTETNISYQGNKEIDPLVASIRPLWQDGQSNRLTLGELFSKLRKETQPFEKDSANGLTYTSAVRLTGVPRSTAEKYRQMWEVSNEHKIPAQVFLLLCEAGFNLATDLDKQATVAAIVQDHPELCTGDIADYDALVAVYDARGQLVGGLKHNYGKQPASAGGSKDIAALEEEVKELGVIKEKLNSDTGKKSIQDSIDLKQEELHGLRVKALTSLARAVAPFLGKDDEWADGYSKAYKDSKKITKQRYADAVKFVQSQTVFTAIARGE